MEQRKVSTTDTSAERADIQRRLKQANQVAVADFRMEEGGSVDPYSGKFMPNTRIAPTRDTFNEAQAAERSRLQRELDLLRGKERGQELFGEGALGRVREAPSQDMQNVMAARRQMYEQGLGAEAFQTAREQQIRAIQRQEQAQNRRLAGSQARSGVMGGLAGAQQLALMDQQSSARGDLERQLFLDDVNFRQQALGSLEASAQASDADQLVRQQFNIGQRKAELQGQLTAQFGEAALGVAERASAQAARSASEYAQATANQGGGGGKK